jgi:outer membrane lipase/esterase
MIKHFRRALACASLSAIAAVSTPAAAQQIHRIVAFGDSYADTGNAFALGYANPQAKAIYPTGRFSGGSNYIDTLGSILQVPVQDFAIGGAFGGTNNGFLCFDAVFGAPLCGKGLQYELDQFLNVGTQSAVFPNAATTLTRSDLVAVSIGGNDARFFQQAGGTVALAPAAGTAAAAATAAQLDRIVAQGNPTISFLALNGALAPEVANDPNAQAVRGAFSNAFYSSLQPTLAGYAANGSIVHYLDGSVLAGEIKANPAAFGITKGLVCPIFPDPTCLIDSKGYLFYGDALHLTSQGFAIVAQYVARQLAAPLTLEAPSDLGLATARQFGRTLSSRSDLYGRGSVAPGLKLYAVGDYFSDHSDPTDQNSAYDIRGGGGTIGAEFGLPIGAVGIAGNYSRPHLDFGNDASRTTAHSWQVGAYGSVDVAGLFGQAYLGYGRDKNRITRMGVVDDMTASPSGTHVIGGAKAGYLMPLGLVSVGPIAALDYARARVDGYTESGDPALTLTVGSQSAKSLTGQLGLEARGDLAGLKPYASVAAEHEFSGNGGTISFAQTDAPIIVNSWDASSRKGTYARVSAGAAASIFGTTSIDAAVSTTVGRHRGEEIGAHVGLRAAF